MSVVAARPGHDYNRDGLSLNTNCAKIIGGKNPCLESYYFIKPTYDIYIRIPVAALVTWPRRCIGMIYCCALRLWSQICVTCRSCWFPDLVALSFTVPRDRCIRTSLLRNLRVVVAKFCFIRVCGVRRNLHVFSLYWNLDLDDRIFDFLLTSMATVQAKDVRASFRFVDDLNGHHQEWLGSRTRIIMMLHHLTSQLCLVVISWLLANHLARRETFDLLMTGVPELARLLLPHP